MGRSFPERKSGGAQIKKERKVVKMVSVVRTVLLSDVLKSNDMSLEISDGIVISLEASKAGVKRRFEFSTGRFVPLELLDFVSSQLRCDVIYDLEGSEQRTDMWS